MHRVLIEVYRKGFSVATGRYVYIALLVPCLSGTALLHACIVGCHEFTRPQEAMHALCTLTSSVILYLDDAG